MLPEERRVDIIARTECLDHLARQVLHHEQSELHRRAVRGRVVELGDPVPEFHRGFELDLLGFRSILRVVKHDYAGALHTLVPLHLCETESACEPRCSYPLDGGGRLGTEEVPSLGASLTSRLVVDGIAARHVRVPPHGRRPDFHEVGQQLEMRPFRRQHLDMCQVRAPRCVRITSAGSLSLSLPLSPQRVVALASWELDDEPYAKGALWIQP